MRVAVVIPIYKESLNEYEKISLRQCLRTLNRYDIFFVMPTGLNITSYQCDNVKIKELSPNNFKSIATYNRLMLNPEFYRKFFEYDYILIYQLDGFVFEDRLAEFTAKGYDYIGAPWVDGMKLYRYLFPGVEWINKILNGALVYRTLYVGNGGVSLRKVNSIINILEKNDEQASGWDMNEDLFFAKMGLDFQDEFKVATVEEALKFSFESNVKKCWERNHRRLPFACHAWEKWDISFWREYFADYGYRI